jgi:hypothetical protein
MASETMVSVMARAEGRKQCLRDPGAGFIKIVEPRSHARRCPTLAAC